MTRVSVVIPTRNAEATIGETLRSILGQDRLAQIVVVNDGSTDGTVDIVRAICDPRIKIVPGPCTGISDALNAGFAVATAGYVARCDADDIYLPDRLRRQADWLDRNPDYIAISGGFLSIDDKGRRLAELASNAPNRNVTEDLREGRTVTSLCTWLIRREALLATGGARSWFETAEDVDLQVRLAFQGRVWHAAGPVYGYRLHAHSITHTRKAEQLEFFDNAVKDFAAQRRETGSDALDRGTPPQKPDFHVSDSPRNHVLEQITGHLTSQAWHEFGRGERRAGIGRILNALARHPFQLNLWKSLLLMLARSLAGQGRR